MDGPRKLATCTTLLGLAVLAGATLLGCACQRARHGVILRGQWSLELNRVPWISQRTVCDSDRGHSAECAAGTSSGAQCQNNSPLEPCCHLPADSSLPSAAPQPSPSAAPQPSVDELSQSILPDRRGLVGRLLARHRRDPQPEQFVAVASARTPLPPGAQEHSRFHPVPTQPVFSNRGWPGIVSPSNWPAQSMPGKADAEPQSAPPPIQIQIAPPDSESEGLSPQSPENQPNHKQDRVTGEPQPLRLSASAAVPSWIFVGPVQYDKNRPVEPLFEEPPVLRIARPNQDRNR